jgi:hypothetical protein
MSRARGILGSIGPAAVAVGLTTVVAGVFGLLGLLLLVRRPTAAVTTFIPSRARSR